MLQKENLKLNLLFHGWTGMDDANNAHISIKDALKDEKRIKYHSDHLMDLLAAIKYVRAFTVGYV
jgi:beta-glucosidase